MKGIYGWTSTKLLLTVMSGLLLSSRFGPILQYPRRRSALWFLGEIHCTSLGNYVFEWLPFAKWPLARCLHSFPTSHQPPGSSRLPANHPSKGRKLTARGAEKEMYAHRRAHQAQHNTALLHLFSTFTFQTLTHTQAQTQTQTQSNPFWVLIYFCDSNLWFESDYIFEQMNCAAYFGITIIDSN